MKTISYPKMAEKALARFRANLDEMGFPLAPGSSLPMTEPEFRAMVAEEIMGVAEGPPFEPGKYDCAQLVKGVARLLGCPMKGIAAAGSYSSPVSMRRALKRIGCETVADACAMQKGWLEIAPAMALQCDVIELADENPREGEAGGFGLLAVALQNGRVLGYHEDAETLVVLQPETRDSYRRAWRLPAKVPVLEIPDG